MVEVEKVMRKGYEIEKMDSHWLVSVRILVSFDLVVFHPKVVRLTMEVARMVKGGCRRLYARLLPCSIEICQ